MTATDGPDLVDGVDVDRVAELARGCSGVVDVVDGAPLPTSPLIVSYLPGRVVPGVRVERDRVVVQVIARWDAVVPELGRRVQAALAPFVGGRRVDVVVADLAGVPDAPDAVESGHTPDG
ncbi:hypothetical protein [Saccharomonospora saliphila]|uniref:hypothetical protein n=1 Tax=Saccharomonospora saliphila TaxID=369829 RepID=UPI00035EFA37|nr:hypothetical protein [Saccharomonospora saliphila]